ncbi:alkaline phosphatase family protein [Paenibacillus sp. KQZ6P-2]|uniref:Alkaline phosphatase family protein n=1 Tax=Paenibacillus mangrovi TaxID=2931978 RepID=A0A9X1WRB9_9BACL|nr:alkaline phosphatase family protein [Paenibacillus mangrovi]MCJ8013613.1 alkaline phosphatase family protein [Paenibacillus mangrovi]
MQKIIFICVDTLMSHAIDKGIEQQKLPAFQFLIEHGQYYKNVVTSFPTMSVSIDCTLLTGTFPDQHRVPGLVWYSTQDKKIINYGTGILEVCRNGINQFLGDALIRLNEKHLNPQTPTIFEELAQMGLTSGSINALVYRGSSDHELTFPLWIHMPTALPKSLNVKGPDLLAYGAFSNPLEGIKPMPAVSLFNRFGLNNEYSLEMVKYLIQNNQLPDFLYVYFPDLDVKIHKKGPEDLEGVIRSDQQIQSLLQTFGSWEEALKKAVIIILGDNGMAHVVPADQQPVIDITQSLKGYHVLPPGADVTDQTEIILAINDRMAYLYKLTPQYSFEQIANTLKADQRFDVLAWKDNEWIRVVRAGSSKEFAYRSQGNMVDPYKQSWTLAENPEVLDLHIDTQKSTLEYGHYSDVLQRLYSALNSHDGEYMVITVKPGYELKYGSSPTHIGAGHGGISQIESLIPLIIAGTDRKPESLRIVDLKSYFLQILKG